MTKNGKTKKSKINSILIKIHYSFDIYTILKNKIIKIFILLIILMIIAFCFYKLKLKNNLINEKNKEIEEKEKMIQLHNYNGEIQLYHEFNDDTNSNRDVNYTYAIIYPGLYRICVYGSKAEVGGKGGKQCAEHPFEKGSNIKFYYEGQNSGGKGGECSGYFGFFGGKGYNGGGLSKAEFGNKFLIVAGGGGGDSQNKINKGGDSEKDGSGLKGGRKGFKKGKSQNKGKNGGSIGKFGLYCGGGGGNGYDGGNGGDYGNKKEVGGGGGGSNYCKAKNCFPSETNFYNYSGFEIFKKIIL